LQQFRFDLSGNERHAFLPILRRMARHASCRPLQWQAAFPQIGTLIKEKLVRFYDWMK